MQIINALITHAHNDRGRFFNKNDGKLYMLND